MGVRVENGRAQLLTRTGLDWTDKYPSVIAGLANVKAKAAYIDGELCGIDGAGLPSFASTQAATDGEREVRLVYYAFDLLHLDGRDVAALLLIERKALLEPLVTDKPGLQFNGHETGDGELIPKHAGKLDFEGVVSKTIDARYAPGNRGLWRKAKWLNRQEFVVVGWSDPEGTRPHLGALLLGYYTDDGKLIYAAHGGTGMPDKVLADLRRRLEPLARKIAHWVRVWLATLMDEPKLVAERHLATAVTAERLSSTASALRQKGGRSRPTRRLLDASALLEGACPKPVIVRLAFQTTFTLPQRVGAFTEALMLRLMPEVVGAPTRPTRLLPKQIGALANDLV